MTKQEILKQLREREQYFRSRENYDFSYAEALEEAGFLVEELDEQKDCEFRFERFDTLNPTTPNDVHIYKCTNCSYETAWGSKRKPNYNYCSSCGAKIKRGEE